MQQQLTLKLLPSEAASFELIKKYTSVQLSIPQDSISGFRTIKRSIDARGRQAWILVTIIAFINEPFSPIQIDKINFRDVSLSKHQVIIIGAGPAGLFAALKLLEYGIRPIILERGKDVRSRRRDLADLNKNGILHPESNYCFGEGGAGTYSDGKLYTRSTKRGDLNRILNLFVQFGAEEKILYESHPHIGTNKLPAIITSMRTTIEACGGQYLFNQKVIDLIIGKNVLRGVQTEAGNTFQGHAVILATGHSARDIFDLLYRRKILIESKSFALGVRIEHPQTLIDSIQYHCSNRGEYLPPASYSLVQQVNEKGVFSFCMCPGGIIAPASTSPGELVVNGWSPSKRNNPFANSGIVVSVEENDIYRHFKKSEKLSDLHDRSPLQGMLFQQDIERKAYETGGGKFVAPAQRMTDFVQRKESSMLPACSYIPGIRAVALDRVLPEFVYASLQKAFVEFDKKMKGYYTNDAVVVATESRTSSPVRIPRDHSLQHPQIKALYPCGEGAGYAGGIVSAAMDGEKVAEKIIEQLRVG
ncbi:MAG: NAD(P)/FAD-dependent oxidoreductase [Chitinophagaceae bacterium]|nr:NAD(P)/FAD-dependent oxidoreductase [Chitinophagaceae bacterium]